MGNTNLSKVILNPNRESPNKSVGFMEPVLSYRNSPWLALAPTCTGLPFVVKRDTLPVLTTCKASLLTRICRRIRPLEPNRYIIVINTGRVDTSTPLLSFLAHLHYSNRISTISDTAEQLSHSSPISSIINTITDI